MSAPPSARLCLPSLKRNAGIDALKGLTILLVVCHHVALRIPLDKTNLNRIVPIPILNLFSHYGHEAVFLFFVISGFLIASHAIARWGSLSTINLRTFYQRRFARIAPCLFILIAILAACAAAGVPQFTITHTSQSLRRAVIAAIGLHLNWYEGQTGYLPGGWDVLWSLSIEEAFYLSFPLICCIMAPIPRLRTTGFTMLALSLPLIFVLLAQATPIAREKAYLPGMAAIAAGVVAAQALATYRPLLTALKPVLALIGSLGLLAVFFAEDRLFEAVRLGGCLLVLTLSCAAFVISLQSGWADMFCVRYLGWLRCLGRLCYEIYLSHMFIVLPLVGLYHSLGSPIALGWIWFPIIVLLAASAGRLIDRRISTPAREFLERYPHIPTVRRTARAP